MVPGVFATEAGDMDGCRATLAWARDALAANPSPFWRFPAAGAIGKVIARHLAPRESWRYVQQVKRNGSKAVMCAAVMDELHAQRAATQADER